MRNARLRQILPTGLWVFRPGVTWRVWASGTLSKTLRMYLFHV